MLLEGLRRLGREGRVGAAPRRELLEPAPRPQPDERGAHLPRAEEREQQLGRRRVPARDGQKQRGAALGRAARGNEELGRELVVV